MATAQRAPIAKDSAVFAAAAIPNIIAAVLAIVVLRPLRMRQIAKP
jgi:hypothetical protein